MTAQELQTRANQSARLAQSAEEAARSERNKIARNLNEEVARSAGFRAEQYNRAAQIKRQREAATW